MFLITSLCAESLHTAVCFCVFQSLSSATLVVWVQCSRVGSRPVSITIKHSQHGSSTQKLMATKSRSIQLLMENMSKTVQTEPMPSLFKINESVEVLVENVNDNPPNFAQNHFVLEVNEVSVDV